MAALEVAALQQGTHQVSPFVGEQLRQLRFGLPAIGHQKDGALPLPERAVFLAEFLPALVGLVQHVGAL